jgi:hypothetical protein
VELDRCPLLRERLVQLHPSLADALQLPLANDEADTYRSLGLPDAYLSSTENQAASRFETEDQVEDPFAHIAALPTVASSRCVPPPIVSVAHGEYVSDVVVRVIGSHHKRQRLRHALSRRFWALERPAGADG